MAELQESKHARETSAVQSPGASPQAAAPSKMLWRVFQLAFRVYNFAGGQDERADRLTATLAHEIEAHPL
jgi:Wiskott-Aldrich syndrome protein